MHTLVVTETAWKQVVATVQSTPPGLETGVKLFGSRLQLPAAESSFSVAFAVVGPGKQATHQPGHYSDDEEHANHVFGSLLCALPGIEWLGELHVHPPGMTWLSGGDRQTVQAILTGSDQTLHPPDFVAGVMQRSDGALRVYAYHFTSECRDGVQVPVLIADGNDPLVHTAKLKTIQEGGNNDRSSVRPQPAGSGTIEQEAPRYHRLRQWRERIGAHGRALWGRIARPRRP